METENVPDSTADAGEAAAAVTEPAAVENGDAAPDAAGSEIKKKKRVH